MSSYTCSCAFCTFKQPSYIDVLAPLFEFSYVTSSCVSSVKSSHTFWFASRRQSQCPWHRSLDSCVRVRQSAVRFGFAIRVCHKVSSRCRGLDYLSHPLSNLSSSLVQVIIVVSAVSQIFLQTTVVW